MTATKQQQMEWLANKYERWPVVDEYVVMSGYEIGLAGGAHYITKCEWQQEREKISSKQEVDNSWYERGELPPVGVYCCGYVTQEDRWIEIEVIAHRDSHVLGWSGGEKRGFRSNGVKCFRPINTEREKAIEDMSRVMHEHDSVINDDTLGALYDAGYRKVNQ